MVELYQKDTPEPSLDLVRHIVFDSLRANNMRFKNDFGPMVLAIDGSNYWRKEAFPHYKANRKKDQDKSKFDWKLIHQCLSQIRDEVMEVMPFQCVRLDTAEADDIIATIVMYHEKIRGKTLIVSGDEDYLQLQKYPNVFQWAPNQKKALKTAEPDKTLLEHILRGDPGDGIPNFLSPENSFVDKIRQKSITQKNMDIWLTQTPEQICDTEEKRKGYLRNKKLIDFKEIPEGIKIQILGEITKQTTGSLEALYNHMLKKGMPVLMQSVQDFSPAKY